LRRDVSTLTPVTANRLPIALQTKRDRPVGAISLTYRRNELSGARVFGRFSKHSSTVQRIVNNLANCGCLRIHVHAVARFQMSNDPFGCDFQRNTDEFRITTRLDVINSQEPFIQRQMHIKSHDYVKPSNQNFRIKWL
jgi:hypothetical protein